MKREVFYVLEEGWYAVYVFDEDGERLIERHETEEQALAQCAELA